MQYIGKINTKMFELISKNINSIITCIPIGENRLKSYKNNGKIIYKSE